MRTTIIYFSFVLFLLSSCNSDKSRDNSSAKEVKKTQAKDSLVYASDKKSSGLINRTTKTEGKPTFDRYKSGILATNKKVKIDKSSNKDALGQLEYAQEQGVAQTGEVRFASNYEMIIYGVGAGCEGKVYSLPIDCPACDDGDDELYSYRKDSRLFINTFCLDGKKKTVFYVWDENDKKFNVLQK
jgi:hypothetical protein